MKQYDLCVVGGGINGVGIARDAAGRGLSVVLCEKDDLAQGTSSASTKLIHGGLRYLEFYDFALVRKSLIEREVLLGNMPHIARPMRFVLPYHKAMRPFWLLRLGLFIYDHLGGRKYLPATELIDLRKDGLGAPLQNNLHRALEYSDCWVDDARLVALNARDAHERGATILTQSRVSDVVSVTEGDSAYWNVHINGAEQPAFRAKAMVNASGPWVNDMDRALRPNQRVEHAMRLVRGSHIVVPSLFDHDRSYFFQGSDGRILFAIPYEGAYTLLGTTEVDHQAALDDVRCSDAEIDYICDFANRYFEKPVSPSDVIWNFAGLRPLVDDGVANASQTTRDYILNIESAESAPILLNVFGGKLTTYRLLAEDALRLLQPLLCNNSPPWTADAPLPGGDFPVDGFNALLTRLSETYPKLQASLLERLARAYGQDAFALLGEAEQSADLGLEFGAGLYEKELQWMVDKEFASSASDALWRRSKLGLHCTEAQQTAVASWFASLR